jgi:hypothetical protein
VVMLMVCGVELGRMYGVKLGHYVSRVKLGRTYGVDLDGGYVPQTSCLPLAEACLLLVILVVESESNSVKSE